jgi:hypothetical protein
VTPSGACLRCRSTRRWRLLQPDGEVGCWTCWRCSPPRHGAVVDILDLIRGGPRTLLAMPSKAVTDESFARDLAEFGAPIALALKPLPCRCRQCTAPAGHAGTLSRVAAA